MLPLPTPLQQTKTIDSSFKYKIAWRPWPNVSVFQDAGVMWADAIWDEKQYIVLVSSWQTSTPLYLQYAWNYNIMLINVQRSVVHFGKEGFCCEGPWVNVFVFFTILFFEDCKEGLKMSYPC